MNINQIGTMNVKERKLVNAYAHPYASFVQDLYKNNPTLEPFNYKPYYNEIRTIESVKVIMTG